MTLEETQRRFTRVCFAKQVDGADLSHLGGRRDRWLLYRSMVQNRLTRMVASGLPRTVRSLEEGAFEDLAGAWLAASPPTTRHIRDVVPAFVAFVDAQATLPAEPEWLRDLLHYECARWTAGYDERPLTGEPSSFAFEAPAHVNPTLRLLKVRHRVHQTDAGLIVPPGETLLAVYRKRNDRVAVRPLPERAFAWLDALRTSNGRTVTEVVQRIAERRGEAIDAAYVEALGSTLATLLESDVILGGDHGSRGE